MIDYVRLRCSTTYDYVIIFTASTHIYIFRTSSASRGNPVILIRQFFLVIRGRNLNLR